MSTFTDEQLDEIDRLIAEKVMGWLFKESSEYDEGRYPGCELWEDVANSKTLAFEGGFHPTRDREQAMMVMERLQRCGSICELDGRSTYQPDGEWVATFTDVENERYSARAHTPMVAICLAALQSAGVEVPQ